jgi:hypothetical protein
MRAVLGAVELRQKRFCIHKRLPCTHLPVSKRHGQTAVKHGYNINAWPGKGRCGPSALAVLWLCYE